MSSSAYSKLVRGVRINFATTPVVNRMDRFDSKTGKPKVVEEDSLQIMAECQGVTIALPNETLLFSEVKNRHDTESFWIRDRVRHRIYDWLHSFGIGDTNHGEEPLGDLEIFGDGDFIGVPIASGSSGSDCYVEVEEKVVPNLQKQVDDLLSKMFKCVKTYKTSLFLLTELS